MGEGSRIDDLLARKRSLAQRPSTQFAARLSELRTWQASRLSRTYDDLRRDPQYTKALEFFLSDLYGPEDFVSRDRELMRAWQMLKGSLPQKVFDVLGRAIELEVLSAELDVAMVTAVTAWPLNEESYAAAYRAVGRPAERERQIDLIVGVGEELSRVVRRPLIGTALRMAHGPAQAAGFGSLQRFLERGFAAFRAMKDPQTLLRTIRERETQLMRGLFAGGSAGLFARTMQSGKPPK